MYRYQDLRVRTKKFALKIIHFYRQLPRDAEAYIIGKQLLRSGTSVAANYRAVQRARSRAEFIAKLGIVVEEADETQFWLELLWESQLVRNDDLKDLQQEISELVAMFTASLKTAKA
jgi:four helix bundle protein